MVNLVYMVYDTGVQLLLDLGLGETEARLYLLLDEERTVMELSKKLELARTSVYLGLEKLVDKGLVERVVEYKRQLYRRSKIEMLTNLVVEEEQKVKKMKESAVMLNNLLTLKVDKIKTEVRYYHGRSGFQQMMWNALSAKKETVGWSEFGRAEVAGEKFVKNWVEEFKRRGLRDRVLANPTLTALNVINNKIGGVNHQLKKDDVRLVPKEVMYISGDTTIYNNVFAVCWWKNGEVVGVEIENPELVKTQKTIFESLWKMGKSA